MDWYLKQKGLGRGPHSGKRGAVGSKDSLAKGEEDLDNKEA